VTALLSSTLVSLAFLIGVGALAFHLWKLRSRGTTTVLQEFRVADDPHAEHIIFLRGRPAGIIGWFFTGLGIDADSVLRVSQHDVTFERTSLFGFRTVYMPLKDVASAECVYYRAFGALAVSLILLAAGALWAVLAWLDTSTPYQRRSADESVLASVGLATAIAVALYLYYVFSKSILIRVESSGGDDPEMSFKRSVIENVTIDLDDGLRVVEVLNNRLLTAERSHV